MALAFYSQRGTEKYDILSVCDIEVKGEDFPNVWDIEGCFASPYYPDVNRKRLFCEMNQMFVRKLQFLQQFVQDIPVEEMKDNELTMRYKGNRPGVLHIQMDMSEDMENDYRTYRVFVYSTTHGKLTIEAFRCLYYPGDGAHNILNNIFNKLNEAIKYCDGQKLPHRDIEARISRVEQMVGEHTTILKKMRESFVD